MADSYDLSKLDEKSFEHMANYLAMKVLGPGLTTFGPGADGGRDGLFEGQAPYPSHVEQWNGVWYIQSKFHRPHLTTDAQKWIVDKIKEEISEFEKGDSRRVPPDNWIVITNVDVSAVPQQGAFDKAVEIVRRFRPELADRFSIWSGNKVIGLLTSYPEVAQHYMHFLTPGHILNSLYDRFNDKSANIKSILRYFIVNQFDDQQYTKLEQAGSSTDSRPGIHHLFMDLPFVCAASTVGGMCAAVFSHTSARNHRIDKSMASNAAWQSWSRTPKRSRVWFIKAGPGQGKSTIGQYISQVQRAAFILDDDGPTVNPNQLALA